MTVRQAAVPPPGLEGYAFCGACGRWRWLADFSIDRASRSGRQAWCRECQRAYCRTDAHRESCRRSYQRYRILDRLGIDD